MSRLHVMLYGMVEGDPEPVIETAAFEGDEDEISLKLADWMEVQAKGLRGTIDGSDAD